MLCSTASSRLSRLSRPAVPAPARPSHMPRRILPRPPCYQSDPDRTPWLDLPAETNYSITQKNAVLTRAEDELGEYCNRLTDPSKAAECWSTYQFLKQKHMASLRGCAAEVKSASGPSAACADLEQLDQMIRELEASAQVETLCKVLTLMKRMEADQLPAPQAHTELHSMCKWDAEGARLHCDAERLFDDVDADGDGKLDIAEFRVAISKISKALSGDEVAQICEALDIHGHVEREQFVDIVMAERPRIKNPESDAEFLRHVTHRHGGGGGGGHMTGW